MCDGATCASRFKLVPMLHNKLSGGAAAIVKNVRLEGTNQGRLASVNISHHCDADVVVRYWKFLNERVRRQRA